MQKFFVITLAGSVLSQVNTEEDSSVERPTWERGTAKYSIYGSTDWKTCEIDDDCEKNHVCVKHMW